MRLFELGKLPTRAEKATIEWASSKDHHEPTRVEHTIVLPRRTDAEFFPLLEGRRFVYTYEGEEHQVWEKGSSVRRRERFVWFGGTDEQPFLTRLTDDPLTSLFKKGQDEFFWQLRPELVDVAEERGFSWRRQGDIFLIDLGFSWQEWERVSRLSSKQPVVELDKDVSINGTRHTLRQGGKVMNHVQIFGATYWVGSGTLEAPDHASIVLERPHLPVQARCHFDPKNAD
ncbi:hypothetical protein HY375_00835 [Candidatus Berkelbacteria bacterium]|nr:hypothetical protein [Candidatus Berkelbacteria bacterium]